MTTNPRTGGQVMSDIQETIEKLRELDRSASPAPWYIEEWEGMIVTGDDETGEEVGAVFYHALKSKKSKANAAILTEVRNSLPDLLAEIERLNTRLATAEARLGRVAATNPEAYAAALEGDVTRP